MVRVRVSFGKGEGVIIKDVFLLGLGFVLVRCFARGDAERVVGVAHALL